MRQIAGVYAALPAEDRARAVIVTGNYGEAGSIDRYGDAYGLPVVYSGQNELWLLRRPPESATVAVVVIDGGDRLLAESFGSCTVEGRLDNGVGVDNEEQGVSIRVCRDLRASWAQRWPNFQHYD